MPETARVLDSRFRGNDGVRAAGTRASANVLVVVRAHGARYHRASRSVRCAHGMTGACCETIRGLLAGQFLNCPLQGSVEAWVSLASTRSGISLKRRVCCRRTICAEPWGMRFLIRCRATLMPYGIRLLRAGHSQPGFNLPRSNEMARTDERQESVENPIRVLLRLKAIHCHGLTASHAWT